MVTLDPECSKYLLYLNKANFFLFRGKVGFEKQITVDSLPLKGN